MNKSRWSCALIERNTRQNNRLLNRNAVQSSGWADGGMMLSKHFHGGGQVQEPTLFTICGSATYAL
jgi:hypothetical protein